MDKNGHRSLNCNGNQFIEYYTDLRTQEVFWSCKQLVQNIITKKNRQCRAVIKTKLIDGYEMIRNASPRHDH